jgi:hypothetical protein
MVIKIIPAKRIQGTLSLVLVLICLLAFPWALTCKGFYSSSFTQETSQEMIIPITLHSFSEPTFPLKAPLPTPAFAPPPGAHEATWNMTYGGTNTDIGEDVAECSGGGFIMTGWTQSYGGSDRDVWLVRTDEFGNHLWNKTFGGDEGDYGMSVIECSGGGFAVAGYTSSFGPGSSDMWLIRTDASGNHLWNQTYGGISGDQAQAVLECSGGGFALAGYTSSYGAGYADFWLIRTDASGTLQWSQTYGGSAGGEVCESLVECSGGGFALTGSTGSFGAGGSDIWLVRTDASGNHQWNQTFGGTNNDDSYSVVECSGGGFAIAGKTKSFVVGFSADMWIIRTDASGNHQWNKTYGGYQTDEAYSIVELSGGGFAVSGYTTSYDIAGGDVWLIRTDANGDHLWNETYGGTNWEYGYSVVECSNAGFAIGGRTASYGAGQDDFWLFRIPDDLNWVEIPTNQLSELNYNFRYDLNASSPDGIDEWWINDTTNFAISSQGIITNQTTMGTVGTVFGLQVWVNDTTNEVLTAEFNVTVVETSDPTWSPTPTNQVIEYCTGLSYDVDATDPNGIDHYWVNDTATFDVSGSGLITNVTSLPVGVYWLEVRAYDPYSNYCDVEIKITVEDTTDHVWSPLPTDQVIEYCTGLSYDVDASDHSVISSYWVNDTATFAVSGSGLITNITALPVGVYWIEVRAIDPYTNYCSTTIKITVQDTTNPNWVTSITSQTLEDGWLDIHLEASDHSGIAQWTINDTVNFVIDTNGHLTSHGTLDAGVYGLNVTATDPYGNSCSVEVTLTVEEDTTTTPPTTPQSPFSDLPLVVIIVGAVVGLGVGAVIGYVIGSRRRNY